MRHNVEKQPVLSVNSGGTEAWNRNQSCHLVYIDRNKEMRAVLLIALCAGERLGFPNLHLSSEDNCVNPILVSQQSALIGRSSPRLATLRPIGNGWSNGPLFTPIKRSHGSGMCILSGDNRSAVKIICPRLSVLSLFISDFFCADGRHPRAKSWIGYCPVTLKNALRLV